MSSVRWRGAALRSPPSKRCCAVVTPMYRASAWPCRTGQPNCGFFEEEHERALLSDSDPGSRAGFRPDRDVRGFAEPGAAGEVRKELAELENRIITRINGTYVRTGECQLREQLVHERLATIAEELKNRIAAGL